MAPRGRGTGNAGGDHSTKGRRCSFDASDPSCSALALAGLALGTLAAPASAGTPPHVFVLAHGTFVGQPLTVTSVVPDGSIYRIEGTSGDHWEGTLTGDTSYSGSGPTTRPPERCR